MELRTLSYKILMGLFHLRKKIAHLGGAIYILECTPGVLPSLPLPEGTNSILSMELAMTFPKRLRKTILQEPSVPPNFA